jgi:hypothetical protein
MWHSQHVGDTEKREWHRSQNCSLFEWHFTHDLDRLLSNGSPPASTGARFPALITSSRQPFSICM